MSKNITLLILSLIIVVLWLWKGCGDKPVKTVTKYVKGEETTIYIPHYIDSIIYKNKVVSVHHYDTVLQILTAEASCDSVRDYVNNVADSNGLFVSQVSVRGELLYNHLTAQWIEKYTTRVDTLKIIQNKRYQFTPFGFIQAGKDIGAGAGLVFSNYHHSFIGGYDLINKNVIIGAGYKF